MTNLHRAALSVTWLLLVAGALRADDDRSMKDVGDPALQKEIDQAIAKGVAYLKSIQQPTGQWTYQASEPSSTAGITALCLYALGASGVPKEDPAVKKGVEFIFDHEDWFGWSRPSATYANALLVLALTRIDPDAYWKQLQDAASESETKE